VLAIYGVNLTQLLGDLIAAIPAILTVILSYLIHRQIKTPSGRRIGELAESTNDLAIVNTEMTKSIHEETVGNGQSKGQEA